MSNSTNQTGQGSRTQQKLETSQDLLSRTCKELGYIVRQMDNHCILCLAPTERRRLSANASARGTTISGTHEGMIPAFMIKVECVESKVEYLLVKMDTACDSEESNWTRLRFKSVSALISKVSPAGARQESAVDLL